MKNLGLNVYLLFVVSWLLHLPARVSLLGVLRLDLVLVAILSFLALSKTTDKTGPSTQTDRLLRGLIVYSIVTIPFVEWPGSVIKSGIPDFIKAIVFYYFTIAFIRTEIDLKKFIFVFLVCLVGRILEPLYLHITVGYWGSWAAMAGGGEFLNRLSGSPYDVVNPNGLAFIICTVLPFLYFMSGLSWKTWLAFVCLTPPSLYALALTGSRSGLIGLSFVLLGILVKSKRRLSLGLCSVFAAVVGFSILNPDMQDRYLSIFGGGQKNIATAEERVEGMEGQFLVVLRRPIFGHGLGTSPEANYHFASSGPYVGRDLPAHNLYLEVAQELGLVGLVIFVLLMKSIFSSFVQSQRVFRHQNVGAFLQKFVDAMQVWMVLNFIFSFASYGLSSYDWYLMGGVSVVMQRLARDNLVGETGQTSRLPS